MKRAEDLKKLPSRIFLGTAILVPCLSFSADEYRQQSSERPTLTKEQIERHLSETNQLQEIIEKIRRLHVQDCQKSQEEHPRKQAGIDPQYQEDKDNLNTIIEQLTKRNPEADAVRQQRAEEQRRKADAEEQAYKEAVERSHREAEQTRKEKAEEQRRQQQATEQAKQKLTFAQKAEAEREKNESPFKEAAAKRQAELHIALPQIHNRLIAQQAYSSWYYARPIVTGTASPVQTAILEAGVKAAWAYGVLGLTGTEDYNTAKRVYFRLSNHYKGGAVNHDPLMVQDLNNAMDVLKAYFRQDSFA